MKIHFAAIAGLLLSAPGVAAQDKDALRTLQEQKGYVLGYNIGSQFRVQKVTPDLNALLKGVRDGLAGTKPRLTEKQIESVLKAIEQEIATNHKMAGEAFLAQNKKKPGVKTTASGLQYEVLNRGSGKTPTIKDVAQVHYRAMLIDGMVFDDSYQRKMPANVPVDRVIKGWTEALQMMKEGDKIRLAVPTELAYGLMPPPDYPIPPNAAVIYELELIKVNPPAPKKR